MSASTWTRRSHRSIIRSSTVRSTRRGSAPRPASRSLPGTRCSTHTSPTGALMKHPLDDAVVLVTGGTGSLGQAFIRRVLRGERGTPSRVIVFSRDEAKQYAMKTAWKHLHAATDEIYYSNFEELIQFWIGDIRDYETIRRAVSECDVVLHAAAMKQVPTCEYFPGQAVATNVLGAENVVRAVARMPHVRTLV